ncbi:carboxymethylenebutenolidase homolog isoform X1 [Carya illinoinensis]|uniref:carboxymethylenebutenolidase homolog isoform X1 n=1 Tax=Carya illinoinensis TaxID=32201 RepID=UPI001C725DB7|nr:carboxymethylenebutenolidase homolog isoform X1 [Carya illinoinensis]
MGLASTGAPWFRASMSSSTFSLLSPRSPLSVPTSPSRNVCSSSALLSCNCLSCAYWKKSATLDCKASVYVQRRCTLNFRRSVTENRVRKVSCSLLKVEDGINDEACELVSGVELSLGEGADNIQAYLFKAVKNNNGTGILLLSDVFGFEDSSTREFAYRIACNGYNVLVPDLFRGDPWGRDRPKAMFEEWIGRQDPQRVAKDIESSTKWMVNEFVAAGISKKLGIIGFCFGGGRVIEVLARDGGTCFGVGVSFYGTRMDPSIASKISVPVLFISGDDDPLCPVNVLRDMEKSIGSGAKVVLFGERGHGFAHRPASPEEDGDAEQAFTMMRNFLYDGLVVNNS